MNGLWLVVPGMLVGLGTCLMVLAFTPQHPRLAEAFEALDGSRLDEGELDGLVDRVGNRLLGGRRIVASARLQRQLRLKGRTLTRHYGHKGIGLLVGFLAPLLFGVFWWLLTGDELTVPVVLSFVGGLVGFFAPDLLLRGTTAEVDADATEALLTYFDLVILERLANQSATQSLHTAAALSDVATFTHIRAALDRARLQQRMPFQELKDLGRQLELPALVDLADVMRLDETGASLTSTLRARVKELRDAHVTAMKIAATAVSERMTVFMVVPSMLFGLLFLVPPLLKIIAE